MTCSFLETAAKKNMPRVLAKATGKHSGKNIIQTAGQTVKQKSLKMFSSLFLSLRAFV